MQKASLAERIIENTGTSLFLTGRAGTGKTTFLRKLRTKSHKRMVVAAPTGIAAINAGGVTLHSFFQLNFGPFVPGMRRSESRRGQMAFGKEKIRMIRAMDLLVIDEVSMVRADMLDAVDAVLRRFRDRSLPFGGVQLLLIGDLQQLPPVVKEEERSLLAAHYSSPYFFDSIALQQTDYVTLELEKVYRQSDSHFVDLLNAVRANRADASVLKALNSRVQSGFNPDDSEGYVRLTTHNYLAQRINDSRLKALKGKEHMFHAEVEGKFPESSFPADADLALKTGAQVMFIKNDSGADRRYFNGMLGTVAEIDGDEILVTPHGSDDQILVERAEWDNTRFVVNESTNEIEQKSEGVFRQFPLRLAWGITIHKSQGLTFDRAIIDATGAFTHGQTYVALSRCRSLEGLVLERPLEPTSIITDAKVSDFVNDRKAVAPDMEGVSAMERAYELHLMESMFNFRPLFNALEGVVRLYQENFSRLFPKAVGELVGYVSAQKEAMTGVGDKFRLQLKKMADSESVSQKDLAKRLKEGSLYFLDRVEYLRKKLEQMPSEHDNRSVNTKLRERLALFNDLTNVSLSLLTAFSTEDFNVDRYLDIKAAGSLGGTAKGKARSNTKIGEESSKRTQHRKKESQPPTVPSDFTSDNLHPRLFDALREWRADLSEELNVTPHSIAPASTLLAVANYLPRDYDTLKRLPGLGPATIKKIGDALIDKVEEFLESATDEERKTVPELPRKGKKPHLSKGESAAISLKLFNSGKSIEEVGKERGLSVSTIASHILMLADIQDDAIYSRLVSPSTASKIKKYLDSHPDLPATWAEIKEEMGYDPGYVQFQVVLARLGRSRN